MKKIFLTITIAALSMGLAISAGAQEEEKEMKTGWSFGVLPTATFSADNGFQAGAFGDVYYYGDGSTYPDPLHKISWEGSYFTKSQRMRLYLAYDSKYLIPGMRVNASVTYMNDPLYSFWGFNGPASFDSGVPASFTSVDYALWGNRNILYNGNNINYYGMSRQMLRVLANFQGRVTDHLNWAAGVNFWNWTLGDMRDPAVDANKDGNKTNYDHNLTLFKKYQQIGAIKAEEAAGGMSLELNAGVVFDTRDIEAAPNKGVWAEAYLNGAPYSGNPSTGYYSPYLKACVYFRHYISIPIPIPAGNPVFAYRLAWQQTIAGETPFYMIQNNPLLVQRNMISEGFGSSNTIRGLRENRILAEGMAWANTELRIKIVNFKLFNQYFYLATNPFFDAGIITKAYRADVLNKVIDDSALSSIPGYDGGTTIYDPSRLKDLIYSAGLGLKLAMNQNFIISAELAKCFTPGLDAGLWIGIGINYQF
ncbi:MAG: hypothetical protein IKZ51_03550 [Bacteroidales bacterium]|nr:hypothetical protein [Bacteroidales bacterium]